MAPCQLLNYIIFASACNPVHGYFFVKNGYFFAVYKKVKYIVILQ